MTIPSIGGNGSFGDKIKINHHMNIEEPSSDSKKVAIDDEEEYSVQKFKEDYNNIFHSQVFPIIVEYDEERKKRLAFAVILSVIFILLGIILFFAIEGRVAGDAAAFCVAAAVGSWALIKKSFEKKVKRKIMPLLMNAFKGFYWQETPPVSHEELCKINIFPKIKNAARSFDDSFVGSYRNVSLNLSECSYETGGKSSIKIFKGCVVKLKMNKNFEGSTIIRPKYVGLRDSSDLEKLNMHLVKLEDIEFDNEYEVYSTDQIEARYLITTSFMERFKNISMAFSSRGTFCAFYGDSVYIAPYSTEDLFDLFRLTKPVTDTTQFSVLFDEFVSILELVDHFKLDKKLGL